MEKDTEIVGQLLFFTLPFIHILFSFFNKVNRLSGPWNQEAFTFFNPYFSAKKKANINFLPDELLPVTKNNDEDGRKIWRNAYHVK